MPRYQVTLRSGFVHIVTASNPDEARSKIQAELDRVEGGLPNASSKRSWRSNTKINRTRELDDTPGSRKLYRD